jgi:CRP-like cAMP-binding protein
LPPAELGQLTPALNAIRFALRQVLSESGETIRHVYFPLDAVVSLVTVLERGETLEAGLVGNDGVVGVAAFLEAVASPSAAVCLVPGNALRMDVDTFRAAAATSRPLRYVLLRYTQALLGQTAQTVACNGFHPIEQRCARWLLSIHDRVPGDVFPLTQEYLAQMLGVRRPSVSLAAQALQSSGVITYRHGKVTVVDRAGLEALACECYGAVRVEYERLLGADSPVVARALTRQS